LFDPIYDDYKWTARLARGLGVLLLVLLLVVLLLLVLLLLEMMVAKNVEADDVITSSSNVVYINNFSSFCLSGDLNCALVLQTFFPQLLQPSQHGLDPRAALQAVLVLVRNGAQGSDLLVL
jgi:glycerol-3-phosphate acyltransferase PlsY